MTYNQKAAMRAYRGAQNKRSGDLFEKMIEESCAVYRSAGIAMIEKTPEPFRVTKRLSDGRFEGHFTAQAQPDFKGTLRGGQSIVFDAKHTDGEKIALSRLSDTQREALILHQKLGAVAGILAGFGTYQQRFAFIPIEFFLDAKKENGHLYWSIKDAEPWEVYLSQGILNFLVVKSGRKKLYNKVILLGRITKNLELKTTPSGVSVLSFGIAVDRRYQAKGEERKADFFNCVAWRELAEHIARNWTKGKPILVEGELQNREYTDKNGVKRIVTEVIVDRASFTGDSKKSESGTSVRPPPKPPYTPTKAAEKEESLIVQGEDDDYPF